MGTIHANDPDYSAQFDVMNLRRSGKYKVFILEVLKHFVCYLKGVKTSVDVVIFVFDFC